MENICDDKQTLQLGDAKTGKYEIMKMVVNMYLNEHHILESGCSLQLYKPLIKIESRLIPMHLLMPHRGRQWDTHGE